MRRIGLLGIDDTARFPVLGSMFVAGLFVPLNKVDILKKIRVKDSKLCTKKQIREKAEALMLNFPYYVIEITAEEISRRNMNNLELEAMYKIRKYFSVFSDTIVTYIDNFDRSREKFLQRATDLHCDFGDPDFLIISHNADKHFLPCSAASIIAKYYHLKHVELLRKKYGDIGNLNPGNPKTIKFIKQHLNDLPSIIRKKYITVQRLYDNIHLSKLPL